MYKVIIEGIAELTAEVLGVEYSTERNTNYTISPKIVATITIMGQISFDADKVFMKESAKSLADWSLLKPDSDEIYKKVSVELVNTGEVIHELNYAFVVSYQEYFEDQNGFFKLVVNEVEPTNCFDAQAAQAEIIPDAATEEDIKNDTLADTLEEIPYHIRIVGDYDDRQIILGYLKELTGSDFRMYDDGSYVLANKKDEVFNIPEDGEAIKAIETKNYKLSYELMDWFVTHKENIDENYFLIGFNLRGKNASTILETAGIVDGVTLDKNTIEKRYCFTGEKEGNIAIDIQHIPPYIILAHETIHAYRIAKGQSIRVDIDNKNKRDINENRTFYYKHKNEHNKTNELFEVVEYNSLDEYETVGIDKDYEFTENKIRKEHVISYRKAMYLPTSTELIFIENKGLNITETWEKIKKQDLGITFLKIKQVN